MEYRNYMPVPHVSETGFHASSPFHRLSYPFPGCPSIPPEDEAVNWASFVSPSDSNGPHMLNFFPEVPGYISGLPDDSFMPPLVPGGNPEVPPITAAAYDAQVDYQNDRVLSNESGSLKRKRSFGHDLDMIDSLRYDFHDNSFEIPVHIGSRPWEVSAGGFNYWNPQFADQAPSVHGRINMPSGLSSSMWHFYSRGHPLAELHNGHLSDVGPTTGDSLRRASVPYQRISFPDNALNLSIYHHPAIVNAGNYITDEHNLHLSGDPLMPTLATPVESIGSEPRELLWECIATQWPTPGYQFHSNATTGTSTSLYGSRTQRAPYVPTSRFSRPVFYIQEHNSSRWPRFPGRPSRRSRMNDETTALARLLPESAAAVNNLYYESEYRMDPHSDMRLDIANMSYEELLSLEEFIGDVSTGLPENIISIRLKKKSFVSSDNDKESFGEDCTCTVCQEPYGTGDELGALDCGHHYHYHCIKQWLLVKNVCPICKGTALGDDGPDQ